jgi:hypothetical protein
MEFCGVGAVYQKWISIRSTTEHNKLRVPKLAARGGSRFTPFGLGRGKPATAVNHWTSLSP